MRLTAEQHRAIVDEVRSIFGPEATVRLFGSRVDDTLRGGYIDLHIEAFGTPEVVFDKELELNARLQRRLGDRRIDVVVHRKGANPRSIDEQAHEQGEVL